MISRLGELTALPAYRLISSYATLAMLSLEHPGRYRGIVVLPCRAEFDTLVASTEQICRSGDTAPFVVTYTRHNRSRSSARANHWFIE